MKLDKNKSYHWLPLSNDKFLVWNENNNQWEEPQWNTLTQESQS